MVRSEREREREREREGEREREVLEMECHCATIHVASLGTATFLNYLSTALSIPLPNLLYVPLLYLHYVCSTFILGFSALLYKLYFQLIPNQHQKNVLLKFYKMIPSTRCGKINMHSQHEWTIVSLLHTLL